MNLEQLIYLYNDGKAFTARWDGKDYELNKKPIVIKRGIAEHWIAQFKDVKLRMEEIPQEEMEKRIPANPLNENNRGEAFAALKNKGE